MAKKKAIATIPPKPIGRPSSFTPEIAQEICQKIGDGLSLRDICSEAGMPSRQAVNRWLHENENFRYQYAHARELQIQHYADEILQIANDGRNDWMIREDAKTGHQSTVPNTDHIQRSKLRVDTYKWLLGKLAPKVFGDKVEVEQTGRVKINIKIGGDCN